MPCSMGNMSETDSNPSWVVLEFAAALAADKAQGTVRTLDEYLATFPGDDEGVRAEFDALLTPTASEAEGSMGNPLSAEGTFGDYELLEVLGQGGQGRVFLARDRRLRRRVALKILNLGIGSDASFAVKRMEREAEVLARIDHPFICAIHEVGRHGGTPFLAMRYVEGQTLKEEMAECRQAVDQGRIPDTGLLGGDDGRERTERIALFFEKISSALHRAHESGVVHRDLKPGNIMVDGDGNPVILDFGLARDTKDDSESLTQPGDLFGTPAYMSPEQLTASHIALDARSDTFSLTVTLFEALTLEHPFRAHNRAELYNRIISHDPPPPNRTHPSMDRDLCAILSVGMSKDRDRRYLNAQALADDLKDWREYKPIMARSPGVFEKLRRASQRHPVETLSIAATVAILAIATALSTSLYFKVRKSEQQARELITTMERDAEGFGHAISQDLLKPTTDQDLDIQLSRQAIARLESLLQRNPQSSRTQLNLASAYQTLGEILTSKYASTHRQEGFSAIRRSRELSEAFLKEHPDNENAVITLLGSTCSLVRVGLQTNDLDMAHAEHGRLQEDLKSLKKIPSENPKSKSIRWRALQMTCQLHRLSGEPAKAAPPIKEAFALVTEALKADPENPKLADDYLSIALSYGSLRKRTNDVKGLKEEVIYPVKKVAERHVARHPDEERAWFHLGNLMVLEANICLNENDVNGAVRCMRRCLEAFELAVRLNPHLIRHRRQLHNAHQQMGNIQGYLGKKGEEARQRRLARSVWAARPGSKANELCTAAEQWLTGVPPRPGRARELLALAADRALDDDVSVRFRTHELSANVLILDGDLISAKAELEGMRSLAQAMVGSNVSTTGKPIAVRIDAVAEAIRTAESPR